MRKPISFLLLLLGIPLVLVVARNLSIPWYHGVFALILGLVCLCPPIRTRLAPLLERLRNPSQTQRLYTAVALSLGAAGYLYLTAALQQRSFVPLWHDEHMYVIQAQMLARFRLWLPPHPLTDFFDTFYILARPVYASQSFMGASLLYTPAVWLHLSTWITPLVLSGTCVGLVYLLLTELFDGTAGLMAAVMMLGTKNFRIMSTKVMGNIPALCLGLLIMLVWLHWRKSRRLSTACVLGVLAGWLAITRPGDLLCLGIPVGLAMLWEMRQSPRELLRTIGIGFVGALPFLTLQLIHNYGITGNVLKTPFSFYNEIDQPQVIFGVKQFDPTKKPQSVIAQKQILYKAWSIPYIKLHQPDNFVSTWISQRVPLALLSASAHPYLLILLPLGFAGLRDFRRWTIASTLVAFLIVYLIYTIYIATYGVLVIPATAVLICASVRELKALLPDRWGIATLPGAMVVGLAIMALPEMNRGRLDDPLTMAQARFAAGFQDMIPGRSVVLVKFHPDDLRNENPHEELVYNDDVAWPDDAKSIRAHDLGARNIELYRYYAARQPDREIYRYDRRTSQLTRLGNVVELSRMSD